MPSEEAPLEALPSEEAALDALLVEGEAPSIPEPICGNGVIEADEECDDGNLENGDGCFANCLLESQYPTELSVSECEVCETTITIGESTFLDVFVSFNYDTIDNTSPKNVSDDATYESSEPGIVEITGNKITGVAPGIVTVTTSYTLNTVVIENSIEIIVLGEGVTCGNAICEFPEDALSCPTDCQILQCENGIQDEDETGVDCGGETCTACLTVDFRAWANPESRIAGSYGLNGAIDFYSKSTDNVTQNALIELDDAGISSFTVENLAAGPYDISFKGDGFLQKIIRDVLIEEINDIILLDYTYNYSQRLLGGDIWPDNLVNSSDIALLINSYATVNSTSDLNRDGIVNAPDMALVIKNYFKQGDIF